MINSEDIKKNGIAVGSADKFKLHDREPIIINTDLSGGPGIHWIVLVPIDEHVYIIDSLGPDNYRPNDATMLSKLNQMGYDYSVYDGTYQYANDSLCGFFAIYVANLVKNFGNDITPRQLFELVYDAFQDTPDDGDIQKLIESFGIHKN